MKKDSKLTPMMKQYRAVKERVPEDAVLLFRLGDFYEMFFEDAKLAAPALDVVLTKRQGTPMCGVPYHALDNYLPRLLRAGFKVAIAEQVEDPKAARGIVKREITRIITPGTIPEGTVLAPDKNNFLAALAPCKKRFGLAFLDISTGDFRMTELDSIEELVNELHRLDAPECIVPESLYEEWETENAYPEAHGRILWTKLEDWIFSIDYAAEKIKRQFAVASLDGFGCGKMPGAVSAAGAILHYAVENLKSEAGHIQAPKTFVNTDHMQLDHISQRNLELAPLSPGQPKETTLIGVLDETVTPMGSRLLREWVLRPLADKMRILERLNAVESFFEDPMATGEIREVLSMVRDVERITARINIGSANARDMVALSHGLAVVPGLKSLLAGCDAPLIREIRGNLHELPDLDRRIRETVIDDPPASISEGGIIREACSAELDELREAATEGKNWIAALQAEEQQKTRIKSLKVRFNKVFGYYIEVSKTNLDLVPENYIRKQTLVNAERFITPELKEVEDKILGAEDKAKALEHRIFIDLRGSALEETGSIQQSAAAIASLDVLMSFAEVARKNNYCRPKIVDEPLIDIRAGRHPVLDSTMQKERFVPNDSVVGTEDNRISIITGPNMAGKSTYIRQVALLTLLAHAGSFIPAKSAVVGLTDRIFTRVGASDDIARGQSTFMVEMLETANILNHCTGKSLVILDEIGRGTSTFDGISIAWAVAEFLHKHPSGTPRTLFATHYHELTELAITCKGVKNFNVAVREYGEKIIFLRQILPGATDKSYGIHVAKLAGLPGSVIDRANEILENLESNALAEAGQPALAKHHDTEEKPDIPVQPTLFD